MGFLLGLLRSAGAPPYSSMGAGRWWGLGRAMETGEAPRLNRELEVVCCEEGEEGGQEGRCGSSLAWAFSSTVGSTVGLRLVSLRSLLRWGGSFGARQMLFILIRTLLNDDDHELYVDVI